MSAETPAAAPGQLTRRRLQFRAWRGTRPFWAGLLVMIGGFFILYFPYAHLQLGHLTLAMGTPGGSSSLIIGVLLIVLGIIFWFQQHMRVFGGAAAILLALVSLPMSNFGGFIVGFLCALTGGAMAVSWAPGAPAKQQPSAEAAPGEGGAPEAVVPHQGTDPVGDGGPSSAYQPWENDLSGTNPSNGANGRHSAG
ncbi:hypothetical protein GT045_25975 [Streptomyces sp. SID486]|uniref:DUF6114 domain-containing protein n=1 Tax=unclassified Streptomyces TaxID=2593676 RepID=UPI00136CCF4B|nr:MULTISPECIES: DUF6114 domain-containing protein [unclassified Streptomyces]MYW14212.1 hypothetical protein [Streptomyces sp. SID2955]MYW47475.1 hypothetical protein [Streptomyces sp. SID161]MYX98166.1 hypothetical protein [Streptomyces sp. SID486]